MRVETQSSYAIMLMQTPLILCASLHVFSKLNLEALDLSSIH